MGDCPFSSIPIYDPLLVRHIGDLLEWSANLDEPLAEKATFICAMTLHQHIPNGRVLGVVPNVVPRTLA